MANASDLRPIVSDILFREWDPIGVNGNEQCRGEYDGYVAAVSHWLLSRIDVHALATQLSRIQRDSMGMSYVDEELHRRVARRLVGLLSDADI